MKVLATVIAAGLWAFAWLPVPAPLYYIICAFGGIGIAIVVEHLFA